MLLLFTKAIPGAAALRAHRRPAGACAAGPHRSSQGKKALKVPPTNEEAKVARAVHVWGPRINALPPRSPAGAPAAAAPARRRPSPSGAPSARGSALSRLPPRHARLKRALLAFAAIWPSLTNRSAAPAQLAGRPRQGRSLFTRSSLSSRARHAQLAVRKPSGRLQALGTQLRAPFAGVARPPRLLAAQPEAGARRPARGSAVS